MKRIALALILPLSLSAASLVTLTGCGKIQEKLAEKAVEKATETATGGDVKVSSGGVTFKDNKTGSVMHAGTGAQIPDGWPSSVPVYPGATIQASVTAEKGKTVMLQSKDAIPKIAEFYKSKLSGMKKVGELDFGGNSKTISFQDDKHTVNLMVTGSADPDQPNMIQLTVAPKQ